MGGMARDSRIDSPTDRPGFYRVGTQIVVTPAKVDKPAADKPVKWTRVGTDPHIGTSRPPGT